jgi:primosomal protein N' (replication factor Y)
MPKLNSLLLKVAVPTPMRTLLDYLPETSWQSHALPASAYYLPGQRLLVPLGSRQVVGVLVGMSESASALETHRLKSIIRRLDATPALPETILRLCWWACRYYLHPPGEVFQQALPVKLRQAETPIQEVLEIWRPTRLGQLVEIKGLSRARLQLQALQTLRDHPDGLHMKMLRALDIKANTLNALAAKGLIESRHESGTRSRWQDQPILAEPALTLNQEQADALKTIRDAKGFQVVLLCGVTGSGKTEVYLQAIAETLAEGHQVLVLIPEINLTPQTVNRFRHRFRAPVLCLHSSLTDAERLQSWRQCAAGEAAILIGTRSALFTPLPALGLIIVDEEHDSSYRQQDGFRYSARDLVLVRGQLEKLPVILGTATPSLETLHNALRGKYQMVTLRTRAGGAKPPQILLIDLKKQPMIDHLAPAAIAAIERTLAAGEQCLLFLNRRGFSPVLMCHDCGWYAGCRRCDAKMTYHAGKASLHCHHCDLQIRIPKACPDCGSTDLRPLGTGTERLENALQTRFADYRILRIDRDTTRSRTALTDYLKQIQQDDPCLLIGTQMLAKGHHFPKVTLVVIVEADAGLFASDFRATEHTAQLIEQVAGRAGRGALPGQVLIQTHHPQHPLLQTLVRSGYLVFSQELLKERQAFGFPPFAFLAILRAESTHAESSRIFLEQVLDAARGSGLPAAVDVWGPVPALMQRKANKHRYQAIVRCSQRAVLHATLEQLLQIIQDHPDQNRVQWHLEVDPLFLE